MYYIINYQHFLNSDKWKKYPAEDIGLVTPTHCPVATMANTKLISLSNIYSGVRYIVGDLNYFEAAVRIDKAKYRYSKVL